MSTGKLPPRRRANAVMAGLQTLAEPDVAVNFGDARAQRWFDMSPDHLAADPKLDPESQRWLDSLAATGERREEAVERLHDLLLRAAHVELARRERFAESSRLGDRNELAMQAANDALVAVLQKLDTFRGNSRFTTWAYKFALLEAGVKARRRSWQDRELPLEDDGWERLGDHRATPETEAESSELFAAIGKAINDELTPHQRSVLIALTLNDVPIDVLAERLDTTRGALYKTLHDARRRLRRQLETQGLTPDHNTRGEAR